MAFCTKCGAKLEEGTTYCTSCGVAVEEAKVNTPEVKQAVNADPSLEPSPKSRLVCTLMAWIGGPLFIHNYYTGRIAQGIIKGILFFITYIICNFAELILRSDNLGSMILVLFSSIILIGLCIISIIESVKCTKGKYKDLQGRYISRWTND